ncbi:NADAR family protein [Clostridium sp. C2-6-12]|uniref:NADAR family protein n=1 Tax=Clostridium sp. C2-6-12 TaxID=2698832 RepID=UPI00136E4CB0|nr:NADAR family protein [Clostridium sp. C2-6-12]
MENKDGNKLMAPLWLMYPHIQNGSIGWRMGYGEGYAIDFYLWFNNLKEDEKKKYKEMFPEPKRWERGDNIYRYNHYWTYFWQEDGKPEYDLNNLISEYTAGKNLEYIYFWGHHPKKEGSISKSCFSQWWKSSFNVGHVKYLFMEQYMMAEKARLFGDKEIEEKIMSCNNPNEIKGLGRKVKNFDEEIWNDVKYSIVINGNYNKFIQNEKLKNFLLSTEDKILVEASPYDNVWGIQMAEEDVDIKNPKLWRGENLLGFALMEVRNEIKRVCKNSNMIDFASLHEKYN